MHVVELVQTSSYCRAVIKAQRDWRHPDLLKKSRKMKTQVHTLDAKRR